MTSLGKRLPGSPTDYVQCHRIHINMVLVNLHSAQQIASCDRYRSINLPVVHVYYFKQSHKEGEIKMPLSPRDAIVINRTVPLLRH